MSQAPPTWSTSPGEGRRDFPSTCWSRILDRSLPARAPLEELARNYWKPVYAYIHTSWAKSHEDAKDLTQDFFIWMMESDFVSRADPARGRFRAFVQVALKHYLSNRERDGRREKRGGDQKLLTLGEIAEWGVPDAAGRTPEEILDRTWKGELLLRAAALLEEALRAEGKEAAFAVFRDYHLQEGSEEVNYRDLAARHGITEVDVSNSLMRTKERFRAILTDLVAQTVTGTEELREELEDLFGGR